MRSTILKQICQLGYSLPFDLNLPSPPKLVPVVFFNNKLGSQLKDAILNSEVPNDLKDFFLCNHLVYVRRNYDGSEIYYLVTTLSCDELNVFSKFVKDSKGGILL